MNVSVMIACCENDMPEKGGACRVPMLRKAMQSVRDGGHEHFECLVCCDGHSDLVAQAVTDMQDRRFKYMCVPKRSMYGAGTQRNAMTSIASGDLLMWLDDDDRYLPGAISKVVRQAMRHPGHPLLFCMKYRNSSHVLWTGHPASSRDKGVLKKQHVGTPMFVIPNVPAKLGRWGLEACSDGEFIESTMRHDWPEPIWHKLVIAEVRSQQDREVW